MWRFFRSPVTRDIRVTIYPIYSTVTINLQQTIFKPESEIVIPCSISVCNHFILANLASKREYEILQKLNFESPMT